MSGNGNGKGKKRVLLTASYGPNNLGWGEDMYDLMKSRLARGHGIFALSSHFHYFGLYIIAENRLERSIFKQT